MLNPIFLIRHASPDWDRTDISYHIPPGPPLTEIGKYEAHQLSLFVKQQSITMLYSSPLERCLHTATIAGGSSNARIEIHPGLRELSPGEANDQILNRTWEVFELALQANHLTERVGLVTHGGTISVLLRALGMEEEELKRLSIYDHANPLPPAGVWRVEWNRTTNRWNSMLAFLPEGQIALIE
jgi:broad specificity phosphatase PhoE